MTNERNLLSDCPSAEDMAALVDGRLSGERQVQMQSHISACDDCFEVFGPLPHEQIALEACRLWEKEGRPHCRDQEHWFRAIDNLRGLGYGSRFPEGEP